MLELPRACGIKNNTVLGYVKKCKNPSKICRFTASASASIRSVLIYIRGWKSSGSKKFEHSALTKSTNSRGFSLVSGSRGH
jgi:hypothetical protein